MARNTPFLKRIAALVAGITLAGSAWADDGVLPHLELTENGGSVAVSAAVTNPSGGPVIATLEVVRTDASGNSSRTRQSRTVPSGEGPQPFARLSLGGAGDADLTARLTITSNGAVLAETETKLTPPKGIDL